MKVIHYTHLGGAGIAWYIFDLIRAVTRTGAAVHLICSSDYEYLDRLRTEAPDVQISATIPPLSEVPRVQKLWQMLVQTAIGFRTARALRNESSVIHINYPGGLPFFVLPLLVGFKMSGFRSIFNVHDVLPHRWWLPRPLRFIDRAVFRGMYLAADKLVVHHHGARTLLCEEFFISPKKVEVIPHGPFRLSDAPIPYEEKRTEIVALVFGHLRENKGIHLAIPVVQKLRADGYPIRLVIAGHAYASERGYWERCKALIEASPTGISVIDRYLQEEEISDLLASAHLLLLPYTEYHSQSGVAALALSNGRPIVAPHVGGLSEVLLPGQTGIVIEQPTTVQSVEKALLETISLGHGGLQKLGEQAFAVYSSRFSWEAIAQEYAKLYRDMETQGRRKT